MCVGEREEKPVGQVLYTVEQQQQVMLVALKREMAGKKKLLNLTNPSVNHLPSFWLEDTRRAGGG